MSRIKIIVSIDPDELERSINGSTELEEDREVFASLSKVATAKKKLTDALEVVEDIEKRTKSAINSHAKELYGEEWRVIKGNGFKINRSFSGSVYTISSDDVDNDLLNVRTTPNSKMIEDYIDKNQSLPHGIERNRSRSEVIKIVVDS